jgi:homocysteine S-methyltransferase
MPRHRTNLPQASGRPFLSDGGIETTLIFQHGLDLPCFAAFPLLDSDAGRTALQQYYAPYTSLAQRLGHGLVLESPTWRASPAWAAKLGYPEGGLPSIHRRAIELMEELRARLDPLGISTVIAGNLGPRGDGYVPSALMTVDEAATPP